jgi:hypothetical protein
LRNGDPTPDGWMLLLMILPSLIFDSSSLNLGCLSLDSAVIFLSSSVASRLEMLKLDRFDAAGVVVVVAGGGGT